MVRLAPRYTRQKLLESIEHQYNTCELCELHHGRTKAVHWRGSPQARLFIIGEGPGAEEDATGFPFVGPSGRKLDEALVLAGLRPGEDVFITNLVACRPPGNRAPTRHETRACAPRLQRMLKVVQPGALLLLGATAANQMAGCSSVKQWHGARQEVEQLMWDGTIGLWPAVIAYHPAYVLRQGDGIEANTKMLADDIGVAWRLANE